MLNRPEDRFFVDEAGKPLLLSNAQNSYTGQEMAKEMGITRLLTFTEQRRVVASKMIGAGATGNTGMAHTPAVQGTPRQHMYTHTSQTPICIHTLILALNFYISSSPLPCTMLAHNCNYFQVSSTMTWHRLEGQQETGQQEPPGQAGRLSDRKQRERPLIQGGCCRQVQKGCRGCYRGPEKRRTGQVV
jgi:hypothetical protein